MNVQRMAETMSLCLRTQVWVRPTENAQRQIAKLQFLFGHPPTDGAVIGTTGVTVEPSPTTDTLLVRVDYDDNLDVYEPVRHTKEILTALLPDVVQPFELMYMPDGKDEVYELFLADAHQRDEWGHKCFTPSGNRRKFTPNWLTPCRP